jgi:hypothetical protein
VAPIVTMSSRPIVSGEAAASPEVVEIVELG